MQSLVGSFLVARPVLKDPYFSQTVVLLLQHDEDGAFGLVCNRPMRVKDLPFPVFVGGPCKLQGLLMLHGHSEWVPDDGENQVAPGIFLGNEEILNELEQPNDESGVRCRLFSGYAGWGAHQLENEIAAGAWAIVPASGDHLFSIPPKELWASLTPPGLPEFSVN